VHGRLVPLRDLAKVTRNYEDPPTSLFRYNGEPAIGLAVGMVKGGNILEVGKDIEATMHRVERDFPVGIDPHRVANQPEVVAGVGGSLHPRAHRGRCHCVAGQLREPGPCAPVWSSRCASRWCSRSHSLPCV